MANPRLVRIAGAAIVTAHLSTAVASTNGAAPFLSVGINVPNLLAAAEAKFASADAAPEQRQALATIRALGVDDIRLRLYADATHPLLPVVVVTGSNPAAIRLMLNDTNGLAPFVNELRTGYYALDDRVGAIPALADVPIDLYRLWVLRSGAILAPIPLVQQWKAGGPKPLETDVARVATALRADSTLATLAVQVPEDVGDWAAALTNHPSLRGQWDARLMAEAGAEAIDSLRDPLRHVNMLGLAVRPIGPNNRALTYLQEFRDDIYGREVYRQLRDEDDIDRDPGPVTALREVIADDKVTSRFGFRDGRLVLRVDWVETNDTAVIDAFLAALTTDLVGDPMSISTASLGDAPVVPKYADPPTLAATVDLDAIEATLKEEILRSFGAQPEVRIDGDGGLFLPCRPMRFPNVALAKITYRVIGARTVSARGADDLAIPRSPAVVIDGTRSNDVNLPPLAGATPELLDRVTIRFVVAVPAATEIFEFDVDDQPRAQRSANGVHVRLRRLAGNRAAIDYRGGAGARIFAVDDAGRTLASDISGWTDRSAHAVFHGVIRRITVAVAAARREIDVEVEIPLGRNP